MKDWGPIGVVDLPAVPAGTTDRRVSEAVVTAKGKAMTDRVDAALERIGIEIFKTWDPDDLDNLVRLMRKFADAVKDDPVKS